MVECPCGDEHETVSVEVKKQLTRMISAMGREMDVTVPEGTWRVPRAYIAFHGLAAEELPDLAREHRWTKVL